MSNSHARIPSRLDHDIALRLCHGHILTDAESLICNQVAGGADCREPVEITIIDAFYALERRLKSL